MTEALFLTCICWLQKTSIPSLWRQRSMTWKTEKWFRCFGKSVMSPVFKQFASLIILCTWTVRMWFTHTMRQTLTKWRKNCRKIRKYFSLSILQSILRSLPLSIKETLNSITNFTWNSRIGRTKRSILRNLLTAILLKINTLLHLQEQCKKSSLAMRILKRKKNLLGS